MPANRLRVAIVLLAIAAIAFGTVILAKGKPPGKGQCPIPKVLCLDVWDPVICDDGKIYSNQCYADQACATGCEPYGDGGPIGLD